MLHTPRLCIDGRAAQDFSARGLIAQEVIDQLVAAGGEPEASSEWIDRKRVVLLSHPEQVFSGQLKRFDTRWKSRASLLHGLWERRFVRDAHISAFHRFRPVDSLAPRHGCPTFTTVLPAEGGLPYRIKKNDRQHFIVPSQRDADLLGARYQVDPRMVHLVRPAVRRYVHFSQRPALPESSLLILTGPAEGADLRRLTTVIGERFPQLSKKVFSLKRATDFSAMAWMKHLQGVRACFYLSSAPFDWATLALETAFWGIPTIFPDENATLSELLPGSPLKLSRFLIDQPNLTTMDKHATEMRRQLEEAGAFDPFAMAKQYRDVYRRIPVPMEFEVKEAAAEKPPCCND